MSLFGNIDVSDIPEDPFWIDDGTYLSLLNDIRAVQRNSDGQHGLSFTWVVQDEDSEFDGNQIQDWKNFYPDITPEEITPEIKKNLSRLKQRLAQIGVAEEDMESEDWLDRLQAYVGTEAYVSVRNTTDNRDPSKKYRNVTFVRLPN